MNRFLKNTLLTIASILTAFGLVFAGLYVNANIAKLDLSFTPWTQLKASDLQGMVDKINEFIDDYDDFAKTEDIEDIIDTIDYVNQRVNEIQNS